MFFYFFSYFFLFCSILYQHLLFAHQTAGATPVLRLTYAAHADEAFGFLISLVLLRERT